MPFGGLVVNRVHQRAVEASCPAACRGARRRSSPSASRPRRTSWRRWPPATPRTSSELRGALGDPPTIVVPELDGRRPRRRGSRASCARTCSTPRRGCRVVGATRLLEQVVRDPAQRGIQVAAEDVAQDRAQAAAELVDQRRRPPCAGRTKPAHRGALERDRLADPALEPRAVVGRRRRSRRAARRRRS